MTKKTITGKNIFDEERIYTVEIMNAEEGLEVFHNFAGVLANSWDVIGQTVCKFLNVPYDGDTSTVIGQDGLSEKEYLKKLEKNAVPKIEIIKMLPHVFDYNNIIWLSARMLKNAEIKAADKIHKCDGSGITPLAQSDPLEQHTALVYSAVLNFPKYMDFFLESQNVTHQNTETQENKKN